MTYELQVEDRNEYLYARPIGIRTRETVSAIATEMLGACIENGNTRVMIDVRQLEGRLRTMDSFSIVTEDFPKMRGKGVYQAAVVDRQVSRARGWFFETVARNRGFNLRLFADQDTAHKWLIGEQAREE